MQIGITFEIFPRLELVRVQKMEQTPEFLERVLERGAGDQESLVGVEVDERLVKERVVVLQPVCFVNRQITPFQVL